MQHRLLPFPLALCLCASARAQCELQILPDPPADPAAALTALALSGERALLGIPYEKTDSGLGRVRVLERSGSSWSEVARLEAAGPVDVRAFGYSVALESDRALVGAANESQEGLTYHGAAYVFEHAASGWTQRARLLPELLREGSFFGHTVALEGDEAFVSAPLATLVQHQEGVAYVFSRSGAGWVQSQELRSPRLKASEHYGTALAVQGDTLFVGTNVLFDSSDLGRVYRYQRIGGVWTESGELLPPDHPPASRFGSALAFDGSGLLVGAPGPTPGGWPGRAWQYQLYPGGWGYFGELVPHERTSADRFGESVALSGELALVGAPGHSEVAPRTGTAWFFARTVGWEERGKLSDPLPETGDECGGAVALEGRSAFVGIGFDGGSEASRGSLLAWNVARRGCAVLQGAPAEISVSAGGTQELFLQSSPLAAGETYLVLGSDLGCSPGLRLRSGLLIPLNPGPILAYTRNFPNQPPLEDTLGLLDPGAAARASITLPPLSDPSLIGLRFHFAYVTAGGSALFPLTGASNAAVLELVP